MKKPIFYKCLSNNECYKFLMEENIEMSDIDDCLDAIGYKESVFISEEEFIDKYDKLMDLDVFDTSDSFKIGVLTMRFIDMSEAKESSLINSL